MRGPLAHDELGDVYEVDALRLQRSASLKVYQATFVTKPESSELFLLELTGFLRDPTYGGRILDFGFHEGHPYIVFDPSGQVVSPEDAIPRIRALVDVSDKATSPPQRDVLASMPSLPSLPDMTSDAELLGSGAIESERIESALPPPPPPASPEETPAPPSPSTPPPLHLRQRPLPNFDEIEVPPDPPFFDSGTIRVTDEHKLHRTRAVEKNESFWKRHGSAVQGMIVALYLLSGAGVVYYFAHGLPNAAHDARMLVRRGQTPQVIQQLEKYTSQPNADPSLHAALGYALIYAKKPHRALAEYTAAIDKDPTVLEPSDVAAIRALKKTKGEDAVDAEALLKRLDAVGLRPDPEHGTGR